MDNEEMKHDNLINKHEEAPKKRRGNIANLRGLTPEQAREIGRRGGLRSGEVRAEQKTLRKTMQELMKITYNFEKPGIQKGKKKTKGDGYELWCAQVMKGVLAGDKKCMEYLRDILGENPTSKLAVDPETPDTEIKISFVDKSNRDNYIDKDPQIVGEGSPQVGDNAD